MNMDALQQKLGYVFRDPELARTALTHSSYANEHHCPSNERLEFVGDSVLGMVVADSLYRQFPEFTEGQMTRQRADLVCESGLWDVAQRVGLGAFLRLGRGEDLSGGRTRHSILADCVEAIIAAIYLDGGIDSAREFICTHILSKLQNNTATLMRDYKTELQELVQQQPGGSVSYTLTDESGPDHAKVFTTTVSFGGKTAGIGEGHTKKEAEQMAAKDALEHWQQ